MCWWVGLCGDDGAEKAFPGIATAIRQRFIIQLICGWKLNYKKFSKPSRIQHTHNSFVFMIIKLYVPILIILLSFNEQWNQYSSLYSEWICLIWKWLKRLHLETDERVSSMSCALSGWSIRKRDCLPVEHRSPIVPTLSTAVANFQRKCSSLRTTIEAAVKFQSYICSDALFQDYKTSLQGKFPCSLNFSIIAQNERFYSCCCAFS